jgi:hypothetical protein
MTLLFFLRSSNGSVAPAPFQNYDGGEWVGGYEEPKKKTRKKLKVGTVQELKDNKKLRKKREEEEFLLLFTDDYDD